jgi:hypothetical protein
MKAFPFRIGLGLPIQRAGEVSLPPDPEPGDIILTLGTLPGTPADSLSLSVTAGPGTVYWLVDANETRTAAQVIAGGGEASGSQAYTDLDVNLGTIFSAVDAGSYYFHAVAVVGSEISNVVSDELILTAFVPEYIGGAAWLTGSQAIPGDYQVGDMMLLWAAGFSSTALGDLNGWTPAPPSSSGESGAIRARLYYKKIVADETSVSNPANAARCAIAVYRNVESVVGAAAQGYFGSTVQIPAYSIGASPDVSGEMYYLVMWARQSANDTQSNGAPTGVTRRVANDSGAGTDRVWIGDDTRDSASAFSGLTNSNANSYVRVHKLRTFA